MSACFPMDLCSIVLTPKEVKQMLTQQNQTRYEQLHKPVASYKMCKVQLQGESASLYIWYNDNW